jgi:Ca2+:H+ antiporter
LEETVTTFQPGTCENVEYLLLISVFGLIIPTVFDKFSTTSESDIAALSRGTSVILITIYLSYALHEYRTNGGHDTDEARAQRAVPEKLFPSTSAGSAASVVAIPPLRINGTNKRVDPDPQQDLHSKDEDDEAKLSTATSIIVLALGTAILAFNTQFMTDSISGIAIEDLSEAFIGFVLIPMLSNDITAFQNAAQDKMNSTIQCALFPPVRRYLQLSYRRL